jgi:hypothetical protein
MSETSIRCRMVACREPAGDGAGWTFHLINDGVVPIEHAQLCAVEYEWGDVGNSDPVDVRIGDVAPAAHALVWRDDGSGAELRMTLVLRASAGGREALLSFEFPRLYRLRDLPLVPELGRPGRTVTAGAAAP